MHRASSSSSSEYVQDNEQTYEEICNNFNEECSRIQNELQAEMEAATQASLNMILEHNATGRRRGESGRRNTRQFIDREREQGEKRLWDDYFAEQPVYPEAMFRRRFRMHRHVFLRIVDKLKEIHYFVQRPNATGRMGFTPLQKCTAAMRMLAYGVPGGAIDEYVRIGNSTSRECLHNFCEAVISNFGDEYLRRPNQEDIRRLLCVAEDRGFPGMLGSIDCMHWEWKNCPVAWRGMFQGRSGKATLVLEAVASQDLWIWHAFFGIPGACNDINVLWRSPLFDEILQGRAPRVNYTVNDKSYGMGYYLTDGIYPSWAAFIQSIPLPQTSEHRLFAQCQEAARKDVERAFGVLQARFAIIRKPALALHREMLNKIMMTCIILHNMIVEDERDRYDNHDPSVFIADEPSSSSSYTVQPPEYSTERIANLNTYLQNRDTVRNRSLHLALKNDLVQHIWKRFGPTN